MPYDLTDATAIIQRGRRDPNMSDAALAEQVADALFVQVATAPTGGGAVLAALEAVDLPGKAQTFMTMVRSEIMAALATPAADPEETPA